MANGETPFAIRHFAIRILLSDPDLRQITPAVDHRRHHDQALHSHERTEKRKEAERRKSLFRNLRSLAGCGAAPTSVLGSNVKRRTREGAARLPAFHHGSCQGDFRHPRLSLRPRFLGLGRSARSYTAAPTGGRRPCAFPRALPAPEKTCPSPAKHLAHRSLCRQVDARNRPGAR